MNKPNLFFYGKPLGNFLAIHNVLKKSNEYNIIYDINDIHRADYILTSHNDPLNISDKKLIHTAHGLGCIVKIPHHSYNELVKNHERYHGYCVHSKLEGLWYTGLVKNILNVGMPISVLLLKPTDRLDRKMFLESRKLDPKKKTIIYMPTWDHSWDRIIQHRAFFYLWWQDKKERERVDKFCKYITQDLNMNLIVRFHESFRYSQNWLEIYKDIFRKYDIFAHYLEEDQVNTGYFKYSDILVGDLSNSNTVFYAIDKPVIHIGKDPFRKRRNEGYCGMGIGDRAGYVTEDFDEMLYFIKDSIENPDRFKEERKLTTDKYIDFIGEESKKAVLREFKRICQE